MNFDNNLSNMNSTKNVFITILLSRSIAPCAEKFYVLVVCIVHLLTENIESFLSKMQVRNLKRILLPFSLKFLKLPLKFKDLYRHIIICLCTWIKNLCCWKSPLRIFINLCSNTLKWKKSNRKQGWKNFNRLQKWKYLPTTDSSKNSANFLTKNFTITLMDFTQAKSRT